MDPTTTLVTFLLQTDPSVQSVQLIGSWDNFSSCYAMKPDVRRGRGEWRGCYSFKDIVCDDSATATGSRRNGGLKMGATYYYYYEVDGSTETHDPAVPCTTACPYLPGQTVNTLIVPVERSLRQRSASLNSLHVESFKTMDPEAKFTTPRPTPALAVEAAARRVATAASFPHTRSPVRSSPPTPSWKRFFTRKPPLRDADDALDPEPAAEHAPHFPTAEDHASPSESTARPRDISPESLRQFLSEDAPAGPGPYSGPPSPALVIPENIPEEAEDDDNFATSATSEPQAYATSLSPPPFQRSASSDSVARPLANDSSHTLTRAPRPSTRQRQSDEGRVPRPSHGPELHKLETGAHIRWSISATSSALTSPVSQSIEDEPPSFYDSNDEDDVLSSNDGDNFSHWPLQSQSPKEQAFTGYSLPRQSDEVKGADDSGAAVTGLHSPRLLARSDCAAPLGGANLLGTTIDTGLDDFVSELGWIVDVIGSKTA